MVSNNTLPPSDFQDSDLMNYLVRMVVPMRREFARSLDVSHFLHDLAYAREVLELAGTSKEPRLREYAAYVNSKMFGPRNSSFQDTERAGLDALVSTPAPSRAPAAPDSATPKDASELTEAEMRARMMAKYKGGLR